MIRRDEEDSAGWHGVDGLIDPIDPDAATSSGGGVGFTLYLEFLGGLIPLLKVFQLHFPPTFIYCHRCCRHLKKKNDYLRSLFISFRVNQRQE